MTTECSTSEQKHRSVLKERYLRFLAKLAQSQVKIEMCENTNVKAEINAVQANSEHFIVSNLETPIGKLDKAVIRASDVVKITVNADEMTKK